MSNNPDDYKHGQLEKNEDIEDIYGRLDTLVSDAEFKFVEPILLDNNLDNFKKYSQFERVLRLSQRGRGDVNTIRKSKLLYIYDTLVSNQKLQPSPFRRLLIKKAAKSQSGVLVITVLTSPYPIVNGKMQRFSCKWNCYYCPNEPGQPRSYLHDEPAVLRANQNSFDPILQFTERAMTLHQNGHPIDKIEILVLGGTWNSYPLEYREEFIRDIFYAANTFLVRDNIRPRQGLRDEKNINANGKYRIIGVTLETRPDCIDEETLLHFRRVGCTRVQLGIQHTDDRILDKVNRQCPTYRTKEAISLLVNNGFKVDGHFMPQLPGATLEDDRTMFNQVLTDPDLQIDQWKIYPCETTPWTVIKKWAEEGLYTPYPDNELIELLLWLKPKIHPWIRLNRIVRDIPSQYILGGINNGNLREELLKRMTDQGLYCRCIRCREVKNTELKGLEPELVVRNYPASAGMEYFISIEADEERKLLGFIRLRLPGLTNTKCVFPKLVNQNAFIRELHVYGQLVTEGTTRGASQHTGLGRQLLAKAEWIAYKNGYSSISVISGVGTRRYYESNGYMLLDIENGEMHYKKLTFWGQFSQFTNLIISIIIVIVSRILYQL